MSVVFPTPQCRCSRPKHRHKTIAQHLTYGNETWFQPLHTPIPLLRGQVWGLSASVKDFGLWTLVFPTPQCRRSRPKHGHTPIAQHLTYGNETWFQPLHTPIALLRGQTLGQSASVKHLDLGVPNTSTEAFQTQASTHTYRPAPDIWE